MTDTSTYSRCLVIGGNGLVGRHLVEDLISKGKQVAVFDVNKSPAYDSDPVLKKNITHFYKGSLNDKQLVINALTEFNVDTVFHTATPSPFASADILKLVNVDGTVIVLDACKQVKSVKTFVLVSSASVVFDGTSTNNADESKPYAAKGYNPYTDSKIAQEKMVLAANGTGIKTVAVRPASIFGERDMLLLPSVAKHHPIFYIGDAKNQMDFTYVKNVTHACMLAAENIDKVNGEAFFITNDEPQSFWGFLGDMLVDLGYKRPYISIPAKLMEIIGLIVTFLLFLLKIITFGYVNIPVPTPISTDKLAYYTQDRRFNCAKAKKLMGYKPIYDMETARKRTTDWYRKEFMDNKKNK
jgi:sterol-4alpha-carboxylate 3-dehydrogenase (decarboxylating)